MKKFIMMVLMTIFTVQMANAADVYISQSSSAIAYHKDKNCRYLKRTTASISKVTETEAKKFGRKPCAACYKDGTKTVKKTTKTTKKTEKKVAEKTVKKSTPARDENGRFVSTKKTEEKATTKKANTTKKATTTTKAATTKKATSTKKATTTTKKSTPARDEKGRFIKKSE